MSKQARRWTRAELKTIKATLEADGFVFQYTVMAGEDGGMYFVRASDGRQAVVGPKGLRYSDRGER